MGILNSIACADASLLLLNPIRESINARLARRNNFTQNCMHDVHARNRAFSSSNNVFYVLPLEITTLADGPPIPTSGDASSDFNALVDGLMTYENGVHTCNLCGKKSPWRTTMVRHVESNHVETAGHVCDVCGVVSKTRWGLFKCISILHTI